MFCYMRFLSALLCLLLLQQNGSTARDCPPGQRRNYNTNDCENCPADQYSPKRGTHVYCNVCSKCGRGSTVFSECTSSQDTICRCRLGFTPVDILREEICVCSKGSGMDKAGKKCKECIHGFFTDKDDSTCQRWKECKSGIATSGTTTSDAVCKNATEDRVIKVQEKTEAPITTLFQTTTMSSVATSRTTTSSPSEKAEKADEKADILWVVLLGAGFLLIVGILFSKCKVTHCIHNLRREDSRKEGVCRKPVEESGEKCLSLLV